MAITKAIEVYNNEKFGPILGVSDEGSAAPSIAYAAYRSAKAQAIGLGADELCVGLIIDGERMGSAGEVPIGPDEYQQILPAFEGRTFATTNVGVRVNTRLQQPLPEFLVSEAKKDEQLWLNSIFSAFKPFIHTPDGVPRPLTVRLRTEGESCLEALKALVPKLEAGRKSGFLGSPELHRLSLLIVFKGQINAKDISKITELMKLAGKLKVPEVAIDATLVEAARRRVSIQGLLNVLDPETAQSLLSEAKKLGISLVYHFEVDQETAARTVWTGLNSAFKFGLSAAKYGLFPLNFEQQRYVVNRIQKWIAGDWTPIPAFYVDTALVTRYEVYESDRIVESAKLWLGMIAKEGAKVALIDAPDRIVKHKLIKTDNPKDNGVVTLKQIETLTRYAEKSGVKVLWSGGIKPDQAFELGKLGVAGIFTTGSASPRAIAVRGTMESDEALAAQPEPTDIGVRRIHALVGAGYLCRVVGDSALAKEIEKNARALLSSGLKADEAEETAITVLNASMVRGWQKHWA